MLRLRPHDLWLRRRASRAIVILVVGFVLLWGFVGLGQTESKPAAPHQTLPELKTYPLPPSLAAIGPGDDYFSQIDQQNPAGSLIWSQFPVTIGLDLANAQEPREAAWLQAVRQAIADWQVYLPLVETTDLAQANIVVRRAGVPLRRDRKTGAIQRARLGETKFTVLIDGDQRLRHRMTIQLSPNQADTSLLAGARHELGHALGLWGHSDRATDIMYFSQVAQPDKISDRDVRTLKRVYQKASRFGGRMQ